MSQQGYITFFCTEQAQCPPALINWLLETIGATKIWNVARTTESDQTWKRWKMQLAGTLPYTEEILPDTESFTKPNRPLQPSDIPALFVENRSLILECVESPRLEALAENICDAIPKEVAGTFLPGGTLINIGWHDIWEGAEHDEGLLFGRAFWSLSTWGYGSPDDWPEYRRLVLAMPEVQKFSNDLQLATGQPIQQCVFWNV